VRDRFKSEGVEMVGSTPQQLAARMRADLPRWTQVQQTAGVTPQ
jgi:hypothetical protein